jgi:hypothetical protein
LQEGHATRFSAYLKGENFTVKTAKSRVLLGLLLGLAFIFVLSQVGRDFGSSIWRVSSGWLTGEIQHARQKESHEKQEGIELGTTEDESSIASESTTPISVQRSAIALAVENREPKGLRDRISLSYGRVYCWIHVVNGNGSTITMRWTTKGKKCDVSLPLGSDSWRTWAYITLRPGMVGPGRVEILDEDGQSLRTEYFEIEPAEHKQNKEVTLAVDRPGGQKSLSLEGGENLGASGKGTKLIYTAVNASSIPDQTYYVTVNDGLTHESYAVLFDIPGDGTEVFLGYTSLTRRLGMDSPGKYIEEFNERIRSYKTVRIGDQSGTVKGYLLMPSLTNYRIRPLDGRIQVSIESRGSPKGGR